jgi:hypothetical protein
MSESAALVIALLILAWAALSGVLGRHSVTGPFIFVVVGYLLANPDWGPVRIDIEVDALHDGRLAEAFGGDGGVQRRTTRIQIRRNPLLLRHRRQRHREGVEVFVVNRRVADTFCGRLEVVPAPFGNERVVSELRPELVLRRLHNIETGEVVFYEDSLYIKDEFNPDFSVAELRH